MLFSVIYLFRVRYSWDILLNVTIEFNCIQKKKSCHSDIVCEASNFSVALLCGAPIPTACTQQISTANSVESTVHSVNNLALILEHLRVRCLYEYDGLNLFQ